MTQENDDRVWSLDEVLARYRRPPVRYVPDWSQRPHPSALKRAWWKETGRNMSEETLRRPLPGSIRRAVYDVLEYNTGQTELEIWVATSDLSNVQIYRALSAMQEIGLVEALHQNHVKLWYRVGASEHNDPTNHPPTPAS